MLEAYKKFGGPQWARIAKDHPQGKSYRTDNYCMRRYKVLTKGQKAPKLLEEIDKPKKREVKKFLTTADLAMKNETVVGPVFIVTFEPKI